MAIKPRTTAGLKTIFGEDWGTPIGLNVDLEGGFWSKPDGARPEQPRGVIFYEHGFGGTPVDGVSRLALTQYRGPNRDEGFYAVAMRATRTSAAPTFAAPGNTAHQAHGALLPQNTQRPWTAGRQVAKGERLTNGGRHWMYLAGGITGSAPGPLGNDIVADGTAIARPVCLGITDQSFCDLDRHFGPGRTVDGIYRPMGIGLEFLLTSGLAIDWDAIWLAGYSNGGGLVYALLANFAKIFAGGWVTSGCWFPSTSDPNYKLAEAWCNLEHYHGGADGTVSFGDSPPASSSAAIMPNPGAVTSVTSFARDNGLPGAAATLIDTGVTLDLTSVAGVDTRVLAPATDPVDARGNTLRHRLYVGDLEGHVPAPNNEFARTMNRMFARKRRRPLP